MNELPKDNKSSYIAFGIVAVIAAAVFLGLTNIAIFGIANLLGLVIKYWVWTIGIVLVLWFLKRKVFRRKQ